MPCTFWRNFSYGVEYFATKYQVIQLKFIELQKVTRNVIISRRDRATNPNYTEMIHVKVTQWKVGLRFETSAQNLSSRTIHYGSIWEDLSFFLSVWISKYDLNCLFKFLQCNDDSRLYYFSASRRSEPMTAPVAFTSWSPFPEFRSTAKSIFNEPCEQYASWSAIALRLYGPTTTWWK